MELSTKHMRDLFGGNIPVAQVLQGIAAGLADCDVTVLIDPNVTIPQAIPSQRKILLPAHVKSERALLIVSWYLDHETGHIIFTPPPEGIVNGWKQQSRMLDICKAKGYPEIPEEICKTAHFFLNCVEDARVENLMVRRFPGCKKHFIGGPIALDVQDPFTATLEKAKELQAANNLPHPPLNPFFVGELHANALLNGKHGQLDKDYIRGVAPPHVSWVLDAVDDNFGDIRDICAVTCEDLAERTDKVMAIILDKKLPDLTQQEEEDDGDQPGDNESEQGGDDRFAEEFEKPKKGKKGGKGNAQKQESGDDSGDGDGGSEECDDDEDGDDEEGKSGSKGGKRDPADESGGDEEESTDADGSGKHDDVGSHSDADEDDADEGADSSEGEDEQGDGEGEGDAPERSDESDDDANDESSGENSQGKGDDGKKDVEEGEEESDSEPVTGDIAQRTEEFNQLIEWAKDAQTDMAQLMREAQAAEEAAQQQAGGDKGTTSASPMITHAKDIEGMPDEYLRRLAPGIGVVVIADQDLTALIPNDSVFQEYDRLIQEIMPRDLGPAARRLMGKFKSAPGKAWQGNRINPKMLQPIVSGHAHGRPLYLRRQETVQSRKGVCVMLCIDCSGSMVGEVPGLNLPYPNNSKFTVSHAAGRGIARLMQRLQIPFAVMGYTTDSDSRYGVWGSSRYTDIVNFLFKDFHEPWTVCEQKMLAMNARTRTRYKGRRIVPDTNSDGESLLWAATQIITRPEDRKIIIVLSDGLPAAGDMTMQSKFLKWAVRRIEVAGIRIGALGIGDQGVTAYYRIHELLDTFPQGWGEKETAPFLIQEKLVTLIDRLAVDGMAQ